MFRAMVFYRDPTTYGYTTRSLKVGGYSTQEQAQRAIERKGLEGYIVKVGQTRPVWNNVAH